MKEAKKILSKSRSRVEISLEMNATYFSLAANS